MQESPVVQVWMEKLVKQVEMELWALLENAAREDQKVSRDDFLSQRFGRPTLFSTPET